MNRMRTTARTLLALGVTNVARVAAYRLRLRSGLHPSQWIAPAPPFGPFFDPAPDGHVTSPPGGHGATVEYFGWFRQEWPGLPDWHCNPFNGVVAADRWSQWWRIPDFNPQLGDIKTVWEGSRFDWVVQFAQRVGADADDAELSRLNAWLGDWCQKNPPYQGINWKCGQEASIRVMHLAVAGILLSQTRRARRELADLLLVHFKRIAPTVSYAVAQDNNHGTSEAAALFIGGSWLAAIGYNEGAQWERAGRRLLEDRVRRLVERDGSFSQYSVNYHRLMLDTLSMAELWRRHLDLAPFSPELNARAGSATEWLRSMTDPATGDAPNIGANDGANLLPLSDADFRDYRPAVQLAAALFCDAVAYPGHEESLAQLHRLRIPVPTRQLGAVGDKLFPDGGYAVLRRGDARIVMRFPRFRFRPSHADALHVDLTADGRNLLRDGGSFSYADPEAIAYFTGVRGHNTVQFDDREPMPRIGRFLWGDWLCTSRVSSIHAGAEVTTVSAAYRDAWGATHDREVALYSTRMHVSDAVAGFTRVGVLRWRLAPGAWVVDGHSASNGRDRLTITADVPIVRFEIVVGYESRFYMRRTELPVLEIEVDSPGTVESDYEWAK